VRRYVRRSSRRRVAFGTRTDAVGTAKFPAMRKPGSIAAHLLLVALAALLVSGCASRSHYKGVTSGYGLEVLLRDYKPMFGKPDPRGFQQPLRIETPRLKKILSMIEVDVRPSKDSSIRERRVAISSRIVDKMAAGLSDALQHASPDQEAVVIALEKHMQHLLFARKTLTSFTAYVEDDYLYVYLSRIDWNAEQLRANDRLPRPKPGEIVMPFSTVTNELFLEAGPQGVKVDWQSDAFAPLEAKAKAKKTEKAN